MKLYEITALAKSGRNGMVSTSDNNISFEMGAPNSGKTIYNPEQLFATGYASCFSQAMFVVTKKHNLEIKEAPINVTIQLHQDENGFRIMAGIEATINGLDPQKAREIMIDAHNTCPYSKLVKKENILFVKINGIDIH